MHTLLKSVTVEIPSDVELTVSRRIVTVKGRFGTLTRSFKDVKVEMIATPGLLTMNYWHGSTKQLKCAQSNCSHVRNMITGVSKGYQTTLKVVSSRFPINYDIAKNGKSISLTNFLGEKVQLVVPMLEGVTVSSGEKDEIVMVGNNIYNVNQSAANVQQKFNSRGKDNRKFIDGVYVSAKEQIIA